jgi:hypothetical protein
MAKRAKVAGIPRTSWEAKRDGYPKANVNYDKLSEAQKKKWITLGSNDVSHGEIGRIGPRTTSGSHTVCYYDANTGYYDDCHTVPG